MSILSLGIVHNTAASLDINCSVCCSINACRHNDATECGNWHGITLLLAPVKVLGRVIIAGLHDIVDGLLRQEQAGFEEEQELKRSARRYNTGDGMVMFCEQHQTKTHSWH